MSGDVVRTASTPTLRGIAVDGTGRGRVAGQVVALEVSDDGGDLFVMHQVPRGASRSVARVSLADGRLEALKAWPDARRLLFAGGISATGRAWVPGLNGGVAWRDPGGTVRVVRAGMGAAPLGVSPDGCVAAFVGGFEGDERVRLARLDDGEPIASLVAPPPFTPSCVSVGERHFAVATARGLWRVRYRDGDVRSAPLPRAAWRCVVERGGARLAFGGDARVTIVDLDSLHVVGSFACAQYAWPVGFASGRVLLHDSGVGPVKFAVHDLASGELVPVPGGGPSEATRLTPDGRRVVSVPAGRVRVFELDARRATELCDGPVAPALRLAWSPDGRCLAASCGDGEVRVLDVRGGAAAWTLEGARSEAHAVFAPPVAFSADGRTLYAANERSLVAWDLATGAERWRRPWPHDAALLRELTASADGRLLAVVAGRRDASGRAALWAGVFDVTAEVREVAAVPLPPVAQAGSERLRFESDGALSWFVRHAAHRGQAAVYRVGSDGARTDLARRGLHAAATALPLDAPDEVIVCDRGRVALLSLHNGPRRGERAGEGFAYESLLDARAGRAAFLVREGEDGAGLVVTGVADGVVLGRAAVERDAFAGALSPQGDALAVCYVDGGVEVFAVGGAGA